MNKLLFIFLLISSFSCRDRQVIFNSNQDRDSIMQKYFQLLDSSHFTDTLDPKFKLLKAYHKNDTTFLKQTYSDLAETIQKTPQNFRKCEEPLAIDKLNFDEAYRFSYSAAFCDKAALITIGTKSDKVVLDFYLYQVDNSQFDCKTLKHSETQIEKKYWDEFQKTIQLSDFWGLSEYNGSHGFDGSNLTVTGYEKPINAFQGRQKTIHRWAAEEMAIGKAFKNLLDRSKNKIECFHYE